MRQGINFIELTASSSWEVFLSSQVSLLAYDADYFLLVWILHRGYLSHAYLESYLRIL